MSVPGAPIVISPADRRRHEIVRCAAELFDTNGYHQTSMSDIAFRAGLAKPTLYHYFRGKDEILYSIHDEFIDLLIDAHGRRLAEGATPAALLRGIIGDVLSVMRTHRGHVRTFFEHHRELADGPRELCVEKRNAYQRSVEAVLSAGIEDGSFRPVDVRLMTLALFGMINWSYQWYTADGPQSEEEIAEKFHALMLDGIGTRKRRR
jgi:AcrR family transcriptional regulator